MKQKLRLIFRFLLLIWVSFVFLQSLFFKFLGHDETDIMFSTIANWMYSIGFPDIFAQGFKSFGAYMVGGVELFAVALLWLTRTRLFGALLGIIVISGAIFLHLATPLGIDRVINEAGDTDNGALFFMACSVWVSCLLIAVLTGFSRRA